LQTNTAIADVTTKTTAKTPNKALNRYLSRVKARVNAVLLDDQKSSILTRLILLALVIDFF
jgi:hypothetical protein